MSYKEFIDNILNTRGRFACGDEYKERHHIIPRCMGGTNDKDNLIDLYAREHFEAHRLLALENPDIKGLTYAWWAMSVQTNAYTKKRYCITAEEYEEVRTYYSIILSKNMKGNNNPFYGKKHSDESKNKIKENHADLSGSNSPCKKSVLQYDVNGKFIKEWDCIITASKELNINRHMISRCLVGKQITTNGWKYMWFYKDGFTYSRVLNNIKKINKIKENRSIKALIHNPSKKPVRCIDTNIIYESMICASKKTGALPEKISMVCNGNRKTAGGYHWEFV